MADDAGAFVVRTSFTGGGIVGGFSADDSADMHALELGISFPGGETKRGSKDSATIGI